MKRIFDYDRGQYIDIPETEEEFEDLEEDIEFD